MISRFIRESKDWDIVIKSVAYGLVCVFIMITWCILNTFVLSANNDNNKNSSYYKLKQENIELKKQLAELNTSREAKLIKELLRNQP